MNRKIYILTFHDGINHGAYLQCYSLFKYLKEKGFENVFVLNYKNIKFFFREYKIFLVTRRVKLLLNNLAKIILFKSALSKINLTKFSFNISNMKIRKSDIVIFGADEIWNFNNPLFGNDPVYFGHKIEANLISYAASFGSIENDKIPEVNLKALNKFIKISVRDKNSERILKENNINECEVVLDPTFLLDYSKYISDSSNSNYIAIYMSDVKNINQIESINKFAMQNNLKTTSISYKNTWCDEQVISLDPFKWINYLANSRFVITNTYHGTLFSIILKKQFITYFTKYKENKFSVLNDLCLYDRVLNENESVNIKFSETINFVEVDKKLKPLIQKSHNYLIGCLNEIIYKN